MVRLPTADSRLILDLGVGDGLASEGQDQRFSSLGTLLKLVSLAGRSVKADKLEHLADKSLGLGLLRLLLVDLGASLDLLDGDADAGVPLLNDVLADQRPGQLAGALSQLFHQLFQGSTNDAFLDALVQFAFVLGPQLAGDALALVLDHVRESSQPGLRHQALPGGLEVSSVLVVEVTAKAASAGLEHLAGTDFEPFAIEKHPQRFFGELNEVDVVGEPLDNHDDHWGFWVDRADTDLFNSTGGNNDIAFLAVDAQFKLDFAGAGDHAELIDSRKDLDLLLLGIQVLGHDGNGDLVGAVLEKQVPAVVQFVAVGLVIEGGDEVGLDAARSGDLVPGQVLHDGVAHGVPHGDGEDTLQDVGNADVADLVLGTGDFSLELGLFTSTGNGSTQLQKLLGSIRGAFDPHLGNKEGPQSLANPVEDGVTGDGPGQGQFSLHLIDGSGLVASEFANISQFLADLFLLRATQVLGGIPDGLLLSLSLGHSARNLDGFLGPVLVTVLDLTVQDEPQNLIQNLLLGPPVVDLGDLGIGDQLDLVGLAGPGRPDHDVGD